MDQEQMVPAEKAEEQMEESAGLLTFALQVAYHGAPFCGFARRCSLSAGFGLLTSA